jgi:hypothetical protein
MNAIKPRKLPICVAYKVQELPQNANLRSAKFKNGCNCVLRNIFPMVFQFEDYFCDIVYCISSLEVSFSFKPSIHSL